MTGADVITATHATIWFIGFIGFAILAMALAPQRDPRETRAEILRRLYPDIEITARELEEALGRRHGRQFDIVLVQMRDDGLIRYGLARSGQQTIFLTRAGRGAAVEHQEP